MKKHKIIREIALAAFVVSLSAGAFASLESTKAIVAEIASVAADAKYAVAVAAGQGDVTALDEATRRSDAVDSAVADAIDAMEEYEAAYNATPQNTDVMESAMEKLNSALQKAKDAKEGVIPEDAQASNNNQDQDNTGGSPKDTFDPPNIYAKPWDTQGLNEFYQNLFQDFYQSGAPIQDTNHPNTPI